MAQKSCLSAALRAIRCANERQRHVTADFVRCMATEARSPLAQQSISHSPEAATSSSSRQAPTAETSSIGAPDNSAAHSGSSNALLYPLQHRPPPNPFITQAQCLLYSFPDFEPTGIASYPSTHLLLPLRRDILHNAVVFEADATRQGSANTKWRNEVHGSGRKLYAQKGTGRARVGDKKSPIRRGGGVAFGPKPRDFSSELPKKHYDLAWRTALSYRYRRGQLIVLDGKATLRTISPHSRARYMVDLLKHHNFGHEERRTLLVTDRHYESLAEAFKEEDTMWEGEYLEADDVDVKDLLELGRIVIEKAALDRILNQHQQDLLPWQRLNAWRASYEGQASPTLSISTSV